MDILLETLEALDITYNLADGKIFACKLNYNYCKSRTLCTKGEWKTLQRYYNSFTFYLFCNKL